MIKLIGVKDKERDAARQRVREKERERESGCPREKKMAKCELRRFEANE
jgi:hypothetical protein